jgi:hypothetical protein
LTIIGVTVVSATTITATINTTSTAAIGPRSIFVTTPGGSTGTVTYMVTGPVVTSISPASALRGQGAATPVSLFGSGLTGATAVNVPGGGITVGPVTVVNDGQVNTTFTIAAGAAGTARNVSITAPGGTSNTVAFTVTIPGTPTLTNVFPGTGVRGTTVPVTLAGTNFINAETAVAVSGGGVTVSNITVLTPTMLTATFAITSGAALGARNVTVTVAGAAAGSNSMPFTVQGPTLSSISPVLGYQGSVGVEVILVGTNLTGTTAINGLGAGVSQTTGTPITVSPDGTTVRAFLNISGTATLVAHNLGLATTIGNTNTVPFTIQAPPAPTLASISPNSATHPTSGTLQVAVTLTGSNFTASGTSIGGLGSGVTLAAGSLTVVNSTTITATFNVSSTAATGAANARNITVTTPGGTTTPAIPFTVN